MNRRMCRMATVCAIAHIRNRCDCVSRANKWTWHDVSNTVASEGVRCVVGDGCGRINGFLNAMPIDENLLIELQTQRRTICE